MTRNLKVTLGLAGIFIAGAVAGGAVALRWAEQRQERGATVDQWAPAQLRRWRGELGLDQDQIARIRPLMGEISEELRGIRRAAFEETGEIMKRLEAGIEEILTPEQRAQFRELRSRAHDRRHMYMMGDRRMDQEVTPERRERIRDALDRVQDPERRERMREMLEREGEWQRPPMQGRRRRDAGTYPTPGDHQVPQNGRHGGAAVPEDDSGD